MNRRAALRFVGRNAATSWPATLRSRGGLLPSGSSAGTAISRSIADSEHQENVLVTKLVANIANHGRRLNGNEIEPPRVCRMLQLLRG